MGLQRDLFEPLDWVPDDITGQPKAILERAIAEWNPVIVIAAFSGGHDSYATTHLTMDVCAALGVNAKVVHFNTGIGIEATREFVRERCRAHGWPYAEYKATEYVRGDGTPDPQIYEELVLDQGFPGPAHHYKMFQRLKERPLRMCTREHKDRRGDKILYASGIRAQESLIRMSYRNPIQRDKGMGAVVWCNPIFFWSRQDVDDYMRAHGLPRNPVKELLCLSGECLCGAFAKPGELELVRCLDPETYDRIKRLEKAAAEAGYPWKWEEGPRDRHVDLVPLGQQELPTLCSTCVRRHEAHAKEGTP